MRLRTYKTEKELIDDGYDRWTRETRFEVPASDATLVGSMCGTALDVDGRPGPGEKFHYPLFDLDYGAVLHDSRTPGHYHLYLDRPIKWRAFKRVLRAMRKAGLIEDGFYKMTKKRGQAFLRVPEPDDEDLF
jgi:hypothetical protein